MKIRRDAGLKKFAFIAHWVETWNWVLWFNRTLHREPHKARWVYILAPVWFICAVMSLVYIVGHKAFDIVDRFRFNGLEGRTILVRNFAYQFLIRSCHERIIQRIIAAVRYAQEQGVTVIGLGALTKAAWLTEGGRLIVERMGDDLTASIVHGDTLTAAAVRERVLELLKQLRGCEDNQATGVFLTGATSKIGRALAIDLALRGITVYMYTKSYERFQEVVTEATLLALKQERSQWEISQISKYLVRVQDFSCARYCALFVTGKAEKGAGQRLIKHLPNKAVVLNFSVPDPLTIGLLKKRPDLQHLDGGLLGYDTDRTSLRFTMRLKPGLTYACHAGTMVHAHEGWVEHEVGPVEIGKMDKLWEAAINFGFFLPAYTSHLRSVGTVTMFPRPRPKTPVQERAYGG